MWNNAFDGMVRAEKTDRAITVFVAPLGRLLMEKKKYTEGMRDEWVKE
jgi:hypothetical protein